MKKILLLAIISLTGSMIIWSQVPQAMTYKAVAKDDWGVALPNKTITLRFTILQGSGTGSIVYQETHTTTTNKFGLMDVEIGKGTPVISSFDMIDWSTGIYYIQIEMDPNGGSNFRLEDPAHQLLSVPYALFAESSNFTETDPVFALSPSSGIWSSDISNWNSAFSWGNHAGLYRPVSYVPAWSEITENPFLITSPLANQLLRFNSVLGKWENWIPDFLVTEVDGSVTNEIQSLTISGNILTLSDGGSVTLPTITGQYYFVDRDADGYGDQYSPIWVPSGVEAPLHFVADNTDCNDNNALVHPDLEEIDDDIDNDCDGLIDEGIPVCTPGSTEYRSCGGGVGVCSGSGTQTRICGPEGSWSDWSVCEGEILPSPEICDGLDNDCDGQTDEDVVCPNGQCIAGQCVEVDLDGDGFKISQGDCNDSDPAIYPGATEICGDGIDQDCNGSDLECSPVDPLDTDDDHDGYTENQGDCNDSDPSIYPSAPEINDDGIDQNCDGSDNFVLPLSFDWRNINGVNWMTPVKNQGICGSCFAVTTVAAFEAKIKIQTNNPELVIDLSEQEVLSCGLLNYNCGGGTIPSVLNYIQENGIVEETVFPYSSGSGTVPPCISVEGHKKYKLSEWEPLWYFEPNEIKETLVSRGPIIFITSVGSSYYEYETGILTPPIEGGYGNKAMLLIGYNDIDRYWIVENTWGSSWGEDGYYRLSYDATSYAMPYKYVINSIEDN